jgi:hypothetical protein
MPFLMFRDKFTSSPLENAIELNDLNLVENLLELCENGD